MGKGTRNEGKKTTQSKQLVKDFEKKKRKKLGIKLKPANVTEVSYRSRSIHVTKQTLKDEHMELRKSEALISADIKDALLHLSHHTAKVRRGVLLELKSILSRIDATNEHLKWRNILHSNLVQILTVFELIYDEDGIVREALRSFINWFIPKCKRDMELFGPFWPSILAHLSAALSHLTLKIRYNALKILRTFFSVSCVAQYFSTKWCLTLLAHLQLLFNDIIESGYFMLNADDVKLVTSLSRKGMHPLDQYRRNGTDNASAKKKTQSKNVMHTQIMVFILCECTTHIIKTIQTQMHDSYDAMEEKLHALLLPNDDKFHAQNAYAATATATAKENKLMATEDAESAEEVAVLINALNSDDMQLLQSLLSILMCSCLIFEQFAKTKTLSSMSMVLALSACIAECLCDERMQKLIVERGEYQRKLMELFRNNKHHSKHVKMGGNVQLFIQKALLSLFQVFPVQFVDVNVQTHKMRMRDDDDDDGDDDEQTDDGDGDETGSESEGANAEVASSMDKMQVLRLNMKVMDICYHFVQYWNLNVKVNAKDEEASRRRDWDCYQRSYQWFLSVLKDEETAQSKIMFDVLQMLKRMIHIYDHNKQVQLLLAINKLVSSNNE
eukprot:CAMPEP_0202699802 /NCGR_PEP_ID=MMETSP1385-20130828/13015_1 /ASSEMBLY_ACC=CAM_ASM_000861 /TAXON_ID=933848 /ORGANISM="Elphidium margaritaceum" /LENGTH=612 /DNA_ID=CAMNT_0049356825 /DNA_START=30 /DNA_END=1868 /DNA_ORIENTATION=-